MRGPGRSLLHEQRAEVLIPRQLQAVIGMGGRGAFQNEESRGGIETHYKNVGRNSNSATSQIIRVHPTLIVNLRPSVLFFSLPIFASQNGEGWGKVTA